jgi:hypothetical protein
LPIVALLVRLAKENKVSFETVLDLLVDARKPLTYFGRKFVQLNSNVEKTILDGFIKGDLTFGKLKPNMDALRFNINHMYSYKASLRQKLNQLLDK